MNRSCEEDMIPKNVPLCAWLLLIWKYCGLGWPSGTLGGTSHGKNPPVSKPPFTTSSARADAVAPPIIIVAARSWAIRVGSDMANLAGEGLRHERVETILREPPSRKPCRNSVVPADLQSRVRSDSLAFLRTLVYSSRRPHAFVAPWRPHIPRSRFSRAAAMVAASLVHFVCTEVR